MKLPTHPCNRSTSDKDAHRINWIDWAKAIGIYLVVTGHAHHHHADVVPFIFMIHMPLFFVISGYLFKTECTLRELSIRNIRGLVIPYILYNIIASSYWFVVGGIKYALSQPFDWNNCVIVPAMNTLLGHSLGSFDGPTWFLLALVWCKYFGWLIHRGNVYVKIGTLMVWAVMFYQRNHTSDLFLYSFDCGLAGFIWFEAGYIIKRYIKMRELHPLVLAALLVTGMAIGYWVYCQLGMCNYILSKTNGLIGILGTGVGLIAFFSLCYMLNRVSLKIVTMVSKASIVVMCLHMPVQSLIEAVTHYQGPELLTLAVDLMLTMALASLFPWIKKYAPMLLGGR